MLTDDDYPVLCGYWRWHRFPAPYKDCLPEDGKGGLMVMKNGVNICAGFLYLTNSRLSWLEFIVSNPDYREKDRAEAIQCLIYELTYLAKRQGCRGVFTSVKNQNLIKHYEACGYVNNGKGTIEMVKVL